MAVDDKNFLIMTVFFVLLFAVGFMTVGADFSNNRDLDSQSEDYLAQFVNSSSTNGLDQLVDESKDIEKKRNPLLENADGEKTFIADILGAINFFKEKTAFFWTFISMIFGVPTFLISSLGMPVGAFSVYLNVIGALLFLAGLLALIKVVK